MLPAGAEIRNNKSEIVAESRRSKKQKAPKSKTELRLCIWLKFSGKERWEVKVCSTLLYIFNILFKFIDRDLFHSLINLYKHPNILRISSIPFSFISFIHSHMVRIKNRCFRQHLYSFPTALIVNLLLTWVSSHADYFGCAPS